MDVYKGNFGEKNGFWKGGRILASNGYILVRVGKAHHLADVRGYAYEHRLIAERKLKRRLRKGEQVHHRNGIKKDNRPTNLSVPKSPAHHRVLHRTKNASLRLPNQANPVVMCACGCGTSFRHYDVVGRPRRYVTGHNSPASPTMDAVLRAFAEGARTYYDVTHFVKTSVGAIRQAAAKLKRAGRLPQTAFLRKGHLPRPAPQKIECACGCGRRLMDRDGWGRKRRYKSGHNARKES